jgi:hypothetical protein
VSSRQGLTAAFVVVAVLAAGGLLLAGIDGDAPPRAAAGDGAVGELRVSRDGWKTDFSRHNVPLSQFISGGPPRDGIAPIDDPKFVAPAAAADWLDPSEPVIVVERGASARAYPHQILIWHEIVNDELDGDPIAVTYCPLCNSALVFDRRLDGRTLRFGTTGNLRRSDLVMWDDATESWWQQLTGEAIVGELTGERLRALPAETLSFADFRARHPRGEVLSRDTGHDRDYGSNPYEGYDEPGEEPFLLEDDADRRLAPKERVVSIIRGERAAVVPFSRLREEPVANVEVAGERLVVLFAPGVRSALDAARIGDSRDVGTAGAFARELDGGEIDLRAAGRGRFRDRATGSTWDVTGRAVAGPRRGQRLRPAVHDLSFWFAVAAFAPDVKIVR